MINKNSKNEIGFEYLSFGWNEISCKNLYELKPSKTVYKEFFLFWLGTDAKMKGLAAPSNLSMNQTLEGHSGRQNAEFKLRVL